MTGDRVKKDEMAYSHLSDFEMAVKVRMLYRDTLEHESVCCGARDRIMYLSQQLETAIIEIGQIKQGLWPMKDAEIARWKDAYENMRDFAVSKGLDITCYGAESV